MLWMKRKKKMKIKYHIKNDYAFLVNLRLLSVSLLEKKFNRESAWKHVIACSQALSRINKLVLPK